MGMLAGVADCGRNQKWGCRGRFTWEFIPRPGSHSGQNHRVLVRVATTQLWVLLLLHGLRSGRDLVGKETGERTLAGGL